MSFESLGPEWASIPKREAEGVACTVSSCGCATCPLGPNGSRACLGPNKKCDARNCSKECGVCRAVCNRRDTRDTAFESIGNTVSFDDIMWEPFGVHAPDVMFQLNTPLKIPTSIEGAVVNAKKLLYIDAVRGGSNNWSPAKDLKARFGVPRDRPLAISFCSNDDLVDYVIGDLEETAREVALFEADYVFGINVSIYDNYPAFDQHVSLRRRFMALEALQAEGVRVIPSVSWAEYRQRRKVLDWLEKNRVSGVLRNLQTFASTVDTETWRVVLQDLAYMRERLPETRIFLVGCSSFSRMKSIRDAVEGPLTFIDSKAQRLAEFHKRADGVEDRSSDVPQLFERNAATVMGWADG